MKAVLKSLLHCLSIHRFLLDVQLDLRPARPISCQHEAGPGIGGDWSPRTHPASVPPGTVIRRLAGRSVGRYYGSTHWTIDPLISLHKPPGTQQLHTNTSQFLSRDFSWLLTAARETHITASRQTLTSFRTLSAGLSMKTSLSPQEYHVCAFLSSSICAVNHFKRIASFLAHVYVNGKERSISWTTSMAI